MAELVTTALQVIQFIVQINNQVQFNKKQCHRLVQRIEQFRPALQRLHTQPIDNDVIKSNLFRLIDFLQEAKRFIGKFVDKHYLMKAFDRNIDYETFTDLNDTLTELVNLLQFGIVCNTIEQHQHDLQDREEDQIELKHILINMKDEIRSLTNVNHIEMIEKFNKMHKEQMEEIQKQKELMLQIANNSSINSPVSPSPAIVRHVMHLDENMMKLLVEQIKAVQLSIISENNSPMTSTGTAGSANSTGSTRSTGVTSPQNTLPPLLKIDSTQVLCDRSATGTLLGGGGFGDVYRGTMAGANVAVKYLRDSSAATLKALKKEALILQIISTHPAIIRYYGIQLDIPPCYLVMEYAICSLYDLLYLEEKDENAQNTITMVVARLTKDNTCIGRKIQLLYETSCALQHLHSLQVTHRDIKPMNILISIDGKAKLTDFGLAKVKHIAVTQTSVGIQKGTATYMPPEILLSEDEETIEYNEKTDVYGFGILMNEVLDHNKPFPNIKMNQLLNKMIRDNNTRPALFYEDIDMKTSSGDGIILELQTLIQRSWNTLQEERPSFQFIAQKLCRIGKRIGTLIPQQPARIPTFPPVNSTPNSPVRSAETSTGDSGLSMKSVEQALPSPPPPAVRLPSAPAPPPPPPPAPKIEYLPVGSVFELSQEVLLSKETSKQVLITESRNGNPWSKAALMCLHATGCNIIPEQTSEAQSLARELFAWLGSESPPNSANARYAHHYLSYIFQYGLGGQAKDSAMSFWHLKQSADIGLPASCALVGYRYMRGTDGADKNPTLAVRYLKQAIDAHDFRGQCWYGSCCEEGIGMNVDASNAMTHYKLSANKGFRDAQHLVGNLYERGFGCIVDIEEAKRWYTLASNQGYQLSKDALARIRSGKTLGTPPVPVARSAPAPAIQPAAVPARVTPPPTASTPSATTTNVMALREYHRLHNQIRVNNRSALQTLEQRISQGIIYAKATVMMLTYSNYSIILPEDKTRSAALSREVLPWLDITAKKTNVPLNSFEEEEVLFAKFFLAKCLFDGIHMTKDVARGFQLIKNCVDRNYDFRAKGTIGHCYIEGVGVTKDTTLGFRYSKEAADSGDYQSIFNVGWCYDNGVGVTRDYNEAMKYYRKVADAGFTDAYSCLGVIYEEGKGVPKDLEEANKWFQLGKDNKCSFSIRGAIRIQTQLANQRQFRNLIRSTHKSCSECSEIFTRVRLNQTSALQLLENEVRANNYWAIGNMAVIAFVGVHIYAKNQSRGIELATQARPFLEYFAVNSTNNEEKGYASVILARYYFEGLSVAKDVSRCYMYASMANDSRISRGVGSYAYYVSEGIGCTKDVEKGVRLTKIAADGGDYQSMHNYAWYLERGVGVTKDGATALAYYKRAADIGFVDSQDNTGHCYENGIGTPKNLAEARRYYTLAAAQGSSYATTALNRIGGSTSASSSSKSGFFRKMFG